MISVGAHEHREAAITVGSGRKLSLPRRARELLQKTVFPVGAELFRNGVGQFKANVAVGKTRCRPWQSIAEVFPATHLFPAVDDPAEQFSGLFGVVTR